MSESVKSILDLPIVKPTRYDGEIDPIRLKNWLAEVENVCETRVSESTQWVHYAKQNMVGHARDWYKLWNPTNADCPWEKFVLSIKKAFYPPDYNAIIMNSFDNIRQTTTVLDYNVQFANVLAEVPDTLKTPDYVKHRYLNGLRPNIKLYVRQQTAENLRELMDAAQAWEHNVAITNYGAQHSRDQFDSNSRSYNPGARHHNKPYQPRSNYRNSSNNNYTRPRGNNFSQNSFNHNAASSSNFQRPQRYQSAPQYHSQQSSRYAPEPEPMDLSYHKFTPLTNEERQYLLDRGLCFKCKSDQHFAARCPKNERRQY